MLNDRLTAYIFGETFCHCHEKTQKGLKKVLIDIVACAVAGSQTEEAKHATNSALQLWQAGKCSIFTSSTKVNNVGAAFVNATITNALSLQTDHPTIKGSLSSIIFPAILSVSEEQEISGEEFLSALLVGYEVGMTANNMLDQEDVDHIRHRYACYAMGATAGVSRVRGVSKNILEKAFGIAEHYSTYSPLMYSIDSFDEQEVVSWVSMTGVNATYLAERGFTSKPQWVVSNMLNESPFTQHLGNYDFMEQLSYKPQTSKHQNSHYLRALTTIKDVSDGDIKQKFMSLTEPALGRERSIQLLNMIERLEEIDNMKEFTSIMNNLSLKEVV